MFGDPSKSVEFLAWAIPLACLQYCVAAYAYFVPSNSLYLTNVLQTLKSFGITETESGLIFYIYESTR